MMLERTERRARENVAIFCLNMPCVHSRTLPGFRLNFV